MTQFRVIIVGAGKIGAMFDEPGDKTVLTHAHAFSCHHSFRLLGFVDPEPKQAVCAANKWGGDAFSSVKEAFAAYDIDVAVVATPDDTHFEILTDLANHPIRLVFAEKPLTTNLAESEKIVSLYINSQISLALNYTRRYVPEFISLHKEIASGNIGQFLCGTGYYGKGVLHNGTHMIDLVSFLLGPIKKVKTLSSIFDWFCDDPTCSAELMLANGGSIVMQGIDCRCHTMFELDLVFEYRRIRLTDSGFTMELQRVTDSPFFPGYRILDRARRENTSLGTALLEAVNSLEKHLIYNEPLPCTGTDGIAAQRIATEIIAGQI